MRGILTLLAIAVGVAVVLKRQRDRELDEAIWEELSDQDTFPVD